MKCLWLAIVVLSVAFGNQLAFGQAEPASKALPTWSISGSASTLHLFGGSSFDPNGTKTLMGFGVTASEYSHQKCPWLGGTGQFATYFDGLSASATSPTEAVNVSVNQNVLTYMFGPTIRSTGSWHVRPFANVLIGGVTAKVSATATAYGVISGTGSASASTTGFGTSAGGGVEVPISGKWGFRAKGNWLRTTLSGTSFDLMEASAGFAYSF